eukprot:PhF_6_TR15949/c0_g3_i5/m.24817
MSGDGGTLTFVVPENASVTCLRTRGSVSFHYYVQSPNATKLNISTTRTSSIDHATSATSTASQSMTVAGSLLIVPPDVVCSSQLLDLSLCKQTIERDARGQANYFPREPALEAAISRDCERVASLR